jgi:hypothetical protein
MTQPAYYDPKIPEPNNTIADSQDLFLTNFSQLALAFQQDHIPLDALADLGNHNVVRLVEQLPAGLSTQLNEISLYSKEVADQTDQLFIRFQENGKEVQLTNYQNYPLEFIYQNNVLVQTPYFTFLPGGIIVYFGLVFPNKNAFALRLEPAIATNIFGVNLGVYGNYPSTFPSTVSLTVNPQGKYDNVILTNSYTEATPPPQAYIIYGSL